MKFWDKLKSYFGFDKPEEKIPMEPKKEEPPPRINPATKLPDRKGKK